MALLTVPLSAPQVDTEPGAFPEARYGLTVVLAGMLWVGDRHGNGSRGVDGHVRDHGLGHVDLLARSLCSRW